MCSYLAILPIRQSCQENFLKIRHGTPEFRYDALICGKITDRIILLHVRRISIFLYTRNQACVSCGQNLAGRLILPSFGRSAHASSNVHGMAYILYKTLWKALWLTGRSRSLLPCDVDTVTLTYIRQFSALNQTQSARGCERFSRNLLFLMLK